MAKKKNSIIKSSSLILVFLIVLAILSIFFITKKASAPVNTTTPTNSAETSILMDIATWYPSAPWTRPQNEIRTTTYGKLTGESIHATLTSDTASLSHFEQVDTLKKMGFVSDIQLNADGPGSSSWGYVRPMHNTSQIILFSYITTPTGVNPNEPLQFNCPCKISLNAFVSKPF